MVAATLDNYVLPPAAEEGAYTIVPPKRKGVPRIAREFLETYLITTGRSYNLQVWNRNPAADSVQVEYLEGGPLLATDVRFVFVRVNPETHLIRCILVLSPQYIVERFGKFGKPTVKQQLIITSKARAEILALQPPILYHPDIVGVNHLLGSSGARGGAIRDAPSLEHVLPLAHIRDIVESRLLDRILPAGSTKTRGQALESMVADVLGYSLDLNSLLGGYPDLPHQALEVKVQDSPTVDLGRYSPQFPEPVPSCPGFTTESIRYLIALTDSESGRISGAVVSPGAYLGAHFAFVAGTSFKSQRSIPMSFFDDFDGQSLANP